MFKERGTVCQSVYVKVIKMDNYCYHEAVLLHLFHPFIQFSPVTEETKVFGNVANESAEVQCAAEKR